eukprot:gene7776-795_t
MPATSTEDRGGTSETPRTPKPRHSRAAMDPHFAVASWWWNTGQHWWEKHMTEMQPRPQFRVLARDVLQKGIARWSCAGPVP